MSEQPQRFQFAQLDPAMSRLPLAPLDEFSGMPLPILQVEAPHWVIRDQRLSNEGCRNDHHHAFFPKEEYTATRAGRVIRQARLQYGIRWAHSVYHTMYSGVPLPSDPRQQFSLAILSAAGYVPDRAVDVRVGQPEIKTLNLDEKRELQEETLFPDIRISNTTGLDINRANRGIYFMQYALEQSFSNADLSLVDEFMGTSDARRRQRIGFHLVNLAFEESVAEVEDMYLVALREGYIHPSQPAHPFDLMRSVVHGHQPNYFSALHEKLGMLAAAC